MAESFVTIDQYAAATEQTIPSGSTLEAKINFELDAACAEIRKYTNQQLSAVEDDTVYLDGNGRACILLPELPVTTVDEVIVDEGLDTEEVITDYKLLNSGVLYRRCGWRCGVQNVKVTYDHGFAAIPSDIVQVAIQMVRTAIAVSPGGIVSETIGGYSYSLGSVTANGVEPFAKTLDRYAVKRVPVG